MSREQQSMSVQDLEKRLLKQAKIVPVNTPVHEEPFPISGLNARNPPTNTWKQTYADIIDRLWELEIASQDPMLKNPGAKQQFINNLVWRSVFYYLHGIQKGRKEASFMDLGGSGLLVPMKQ